MDGFKDMKPVRYVIQTILPQVYTDALSNQELLSKIVSYLNDLIKNNNELPDFIQETVENYITSGAINEVVNDILVNFMLNVKNPPNNLKPASGDGTEDDTEAIQGCIDYARDMGGGCVYFPNGVYLTQPLVLYDNVSLFGFDRYSSKLVLKGGANTHMFTGNVTNTSITGMTIDGNMDIQVNNLNLIDIVADELILQNLILTDGYVLVNAVVNKTSQISNVIFDYAVVKHMEVSGSGIVLGNNLYLHDISTIKGENLLTLNTSNSVLSNVVSNGVSPVGFILNGNNNNVSGTFDNAVIPFQDNGQNNTIINNGKTEQVKITGNRINNVGGNETDNVVGDKIINANNIILNPNNPLIYRTPDELNDYFKTIPFKDNNSDYLVLVQGNKDIKQYVDSVNQLLANEIEEREDNNQLLQNALLNEETERENNDTILQHNIDTEIQNRIDSENAINEEINKIKSGLLVNIKDFGAKGDGITDDTQALKNALEYCKPFKGTVFIPPSQKPYVLASNDIEIPLGVGILGASGRWNGIFDVNFGGSSFYITSTTGMGTFLAGEASTIKGINIKYPNQTLTNPPIAYPPTIKVTGYRDITISDVFCFNAYTFIDATSDHERLRLENLYFDAYKAGIVINMSWDVDIIRNVHDWTFSTSDGLGVTPEQRTAIFNFKYNNKTSIELQRVDGFIMENIFIWGCMIALHLNGACYGTISNFESDYNMIAVKCDSINPNGVLISNFNNANHPSIKEYNPSIVNTVSFLMNNVVGKLLVSNASTWGGSDYFVITTNRYTNASLTSIDNCSVSETSGDSIVLNDGASGSVNISKLYCKDDKPMCKTLNNSPCVIVFNNPTIKHEIFLGRNQPIKRERLTRYEEIESGFTVYTMYSNVVALTGSETVENIECLLEKGDILTIICKGNAIISGQTNYTLRLNGQFIGVPNATLQLLWTGEHLVEVCRTIPT